MMRSLALILVVATLAACTDPAVKISFDLDLLDDSGLIGGAGSKRALSYEFCVPDDPATISGVEAIDPSAEAQSSPGRIGCTDSQRLMIGHTHQERYREILLDLASRPDIERIEQAFFE